MQEINGVSGTMKTDTARCKKKVGARAAGMGMVADTIDQDISMHTKKGVLCYLMISHAT